MHLPVITDSLHKIPLHPLRDASLKLVSRLRWLVKCVVLRRFTDVVTILPARAVSIAAFCSLVLLPTIGRLRSILSTRTHTINSCKVCPTLGWATAFVSRTRSSFRLQWCLETTWALLGSSGPWLYSNTNLPNDSMGPPLAPTFHIWRVSVSCFSLCLYPRRPSPSLSLSLFLKS